MPPWRPRMAPDIGGYYRSVLGNAAIRQNVNIWGPWSPHSFFSIHFAATALLAAAAVAWAVRRGHRPDLVARRARRRARSSPACTQFATRLWFAIPAAIVAAEALAFTSGSARTLFGQTTRRAAGAVPLVGGGHLRARAREHLERDVPAHVPTDDGDSHSQTMPARALRPRPGRLRGRACPALAASGTRGPDRVRHPVRDLPATPARGWFRFNDGAPGWDAATSGYDLLAISSSRHPELAARIRAAPDWRVDRSDAQGLIASRTRSPAGCG